MDRFYFASLFDDYGGPQDMGVYKVDASGNFVWGYQVGLTEAIGDDLSQYDTAYGSVISNGVIYMAGETAGGVFQTNGGGRDIIITTVNIETGKH